MTINKERLANSVDKKIKERIFLDSNILLTAICYNYSDSAILLYQCKKGIIKGIISQIVIDECHQKLNCYPELLKEFNELIRHLEIIKISEKDINKYTTIADPNDRHILAGAEVGCADYIVTLDWKHFLSSSAKNRLANYPIPRVFPGILTSAFRYNKFPIVSIGLTKGTFAIAVDPQWTSETIRHANHPFFVLDLPGVFSIWYEPSRFHFKVRMEVYDNQKILTVRRYINDSDAFLCVIAWDLDQGFTFMLDNQLRTICQRWRKVPMEGKLWVGSDRNGVNQINSLIVFHGWPRALTEKEMRRVLEGGYVLLPETPVSL